MQVALSGPTFLGVHKAGRSIGCPNSHEARTGRVINICSGTLSTHVHPRETMARHRNACPIFLKLNAIDNASKESDINNNGLLANPWPFGTVKKKRTMGGEKKTYWKFGFLYIGLNGKNLGIDEVNNSAYLGIPDLKEGKD